MKRLEVVQSLDKWVILHNDEALASFDTEEEAQRAAHAIARTQPPGEEEAEVVVRE